MSQAARAARLLPVGEIETGARQAHGEDLTEMVAALATLTADHSRRSRQHTPTARPD